MWRLLTLGCNRKKPATFTKNLTMFDKLRAFFEHQFPITDEQFEFVKTLFIPKKVSKGAFLLLEGEITKHSFLLHRAVYVLTL